MVNRIYLKDGVFHKELESDKYDHFGLEEEIMHLVERYYDKYNKYPVIIVGKKMQADWTDPFAATKEGDIFALFGCCQARIGVFEWGFYLE